MSASISETIDWDATPRDRAVTRGLLNGLGRPRGHFFLPSLPTEVVVAVLTLGLRPLRVASVRADRWRRYEWLLLGEFATWWHARSGDVEAKALAATAERLARPRSNWLTSWVILLAIAVLAWAAWRGGVMGAGRAAFFPWWFDGSAAAFAACVSVGWADVWRSTNRERTWSRAWLGRLSRMLAADEHRPIAPTPAAPATAAFAVALVIALVGPFWLAAALATLAHQSAVIRTFRPAKLRLVERMLERMDSSGLPIEYDVEAMHRAGGE